MDIKDCKVGDRCWVAFGGIETQDGTNATITGLGDNGIRVDTDSKLYGVVRSPGDTAFWRKPEAPPKPKRKVTKTFTGWLSDTGLSVLGSPAHLRGVTLSDARAEANPHPATITVEVEE